MTAADLLDRMAALWRRERAAAREQFAAGRRHTSLRTRVTRGLALADLTVTDWRPAPGARTRVCLTPPGHVDLDEVRLGPGEPVVLWRQDPDQPLARGVISRRDRDDLWVVIDGELPELIALAGCHLDASAPESTFDRGERAIARARAAPSSSPLAAMLAVLTGQRHPGAPRAAAWTVHDRELDRAQRDAVATALAAAEIGLIHGPPGTGKTRTLVEVIRAVHDGGEPVLATAASNTAVDNLGERLAAAGLDVVRLGHPARVGPALEEHTLDARVAASDGAALARELSDRARAVRRRAGHARGADARALWSEARSLERDARDALTQAEQRIVHNAAVVLTTCTGADHPALGERRFGVVVIDEATQVPDPLALIALARADRAVLAGDPHQLPPTVVDAGAARDGLATTFFERLAARAGAAMLIRQHRMHADIMHFPSHSKYGGRLIAAPAVAGHTLADLGASDDPERGTALWLLDTAGKDWTDRRGGDGDDHDDPRSDPSTWNPGSAERTAREVRRLLSRGVAASDIAVIAPYHAHIRRLRTLLAPERAAGLEIATVDGFQGREKEAVVVDLVRSNPDGELGFLADTRRMNVALTRARRFLLVIGDSATLGDHAYYGALVTAMDQLGAHGSAWADDGDPVDR